MKFVPRNFKPRKKRSSFVYFNLKKISISCIMCTKEDVSNCCRVCLADNPTIDFSVVSGEKTLLEKFISCTSLQIDETIYQTKICKCCAENLNVAYNFKILAETTNKKIINYIEQQRLVCESPVVDIQLFDEEFMHEIEIDDVEDIQININEEHETHIDDKSIDKHVNKLPRIKNKKFICEICKKVFLYQSHLVRHVNTHSADKEFKCDICNKDFRNSYNLSVHLKIHAGIFSLKCKICDKGSSTPSALRRHMLTHAKEALYACKYCDNEYFHKSSLVLHEKMHFENKTYSCNLCFKIFSYKNTLTEHMKVHAGIKNHKCELCLMTFTRKTTMLVHTKSCKGIKKKIRKNNVRTNKLGKCCKKLTGNKGELLKHMIEHSKY